MSPSAGSRLVNADTLAAALLASFTGGPGGCLFEPDAAHMAFHESDAAAILAAIPPDPRLDALLKAADAYSTHIDPYTYVALRDALAAFEEKVP